MAQDTPADNIGKNERDGPGETKTSSDESNSPEDIMTTAAIRRLIVDDSAFATTAKNVKIVTAKGMVTLRGPVSSANEKGKIAQLAAAVVGSEMVNNQLEIADKR